MKIALLYSLLIYQLLRHCDATGRCEPLSEVRKASFGDETGTVLVNRGSNVPIYSLIDDCNDDNINSYMLLHQNHHTGKLDVVSQQQDHKFMISNVQLNTSGIYCTYKQCAFKDKEEHCCIRVIVPPEVKIIFPDPVQSNIQERGVCYAKSWPLLTTNDIDMFTDDNCAITKLPLDNIDTYTSAIFFALDNINSSCQHISCLTKFNKEVKYTNKKHASTTSTIGDNIITTAPGLAFIPEPFEPNDVSDSALGLYRITLWIIVLTLTILSMTITSLPNLL